MGVKRLFFILLGVGLFAGKSRGIIIHPKNPFEGVKQYVDSLQNDYLNNSSDLRIEAAFALWSIYNHTDLFNEAAIPYINKVDSAELTTRIKDFMASATSARHKQEWSLLQLRKRLDKQPGFKTKINVNSLETEELKAAYYIVTTGELSLFDINGFKHLQNFKKCYEIAKTKVSLAAFEFLCLRNFGMEQFHRNNLDSSVYYFEKIIPVCKKINHWSYKYIPGYGVFYREKQAQGRMHMNLGMSIEKTGNIVRAISEYERGERQFDSCEYFPGIWWGKSQIINSYLDLGEFERTQKLVSELIASIQGYFGKVSIDNEFMWIGLHEFDYFDLYQTRRYLDSVLTKLEREGDPVPFKRRLKTRNPLEYSYQQRYTTVRLALNHMLNEKPISNDIFGIIDSLKNNYLADPLIEYATKEYIYNSMKFNEAAWHVALDHENNPKLVERFFEFVQKPDSIYNYNGHLKTILILFHSLGKYKVEERVISTYLPAIEKGNNVVAQRKLYYQYADVLKKLGRHKEALIYFQKSDSIRQVLNSLNHLERLNNYDRRLEVERAKREKAVLEMENASLQNKRTQLSIVVVGLIISLVLAIGLIHVNRRRITAKKKQLEAEKELLSSDLKSEAEKVRLASLEIMKGNQSFSQLISDVENLKGDLSPENRKKVLSLLIDHKTKTQDDIWQQFNLQFQSQFQGFYQNLSSKFPDLTENEQRLCAMHLSDLNNKEINAITGQKLSSIHTMKSKVRKKLNVENDNELVKLLETFA